MLFINKVKILQETEAWQKNGRKLRKKNHIQGKNFETVIFFIIIAWPRGEEKTRTTRSWLN